VRGIGFGQMGTVFTLVHVQKYVMSNLAKDIAPGVSIPGESEWLCLLFW